jgi:hypothetical protein
MMSHIGVLVDPVYLAEPLVKSEEFTRAQRDLPAQTWLWVVRAGGRRLRPRPKARSPAYMPGEHPFKGEFETKHHLPEFAIRGGPETMYPGIPGADPRVAREESTAAAAPGGRSDATNRFASQRWPPP